jgi:beta-xylosidase
VAEALQDPAATAEAIEYQWLLNPSDDDLLQDLLDVALEHSLNDVLERTLRKMERINPIDPRLYAARVQLYDNRQEPELLLRAVVRYLRVGGRNPAVLQIGRETAQAQGDEEMLRQLDMGSQPADAGS